MGTCAVGPVVYVLPDETYYTEMTPERVKDVVQKHFIGGEPVTEYTFYDSIQKKRVSNIHDVAFFRDQVRIALRNCGLIDVNCINSYVSKDGYLALARILEKGDRMAVIEELKRSGLRGRGGAGFPAGVKWEAAYHEPGEEKYIICNADEGDPGAFMDRSVFEGDPHSVIEGMLIAAMPLARPTALYISGRSIPLPWNVSRRHWRWLGRKACWGKISSALVLTLTSKFGLAQVLSSVVRKLR